MAHIAHALEGVSEARMQLLLGLPMIPVSPRGLRGRRGQIYLRRTLSTLVGERLQPGAPDDFVTQMIRSLHNRFPEGEAIELAVDNAATFYLAGHETTANAISWTLFMLSEQPEWQERASVEAAAAVASGVDSELPRRLPLLRMIVDEVLRLYPSAPRFDREALAADRIGEIDVQPCGTTRTRSIPSDSRQRRRTSGTASSTFRSARGREPASELASPWPKG
jgi:cytochrome P450